MEPLPYLLFSLFLLSLAVVAVLATRRRRILLFGGLIALPNAVLELVFIPAYWTPTLVFGGPFGLEDIIFSFSAGVLACSLSLVAFRGRLEERVSLPIAITRWLRLELLFLVCFGVLLMADLPVMSAALLALCGVALFLSRRSVRLVPLALFGGPGFALLYGLALALAFSVWPDWSDAWNKAQLSGGQVLGVFGEEWAWALGFGAIHAWATGHVLGLRVPRGASVTA